MATNTRNKARKVEENREKRPRAVARHIRISPYKVRTVLDVVRGMEAKKAVAVLQNMSKGGAEAVLKVVKSAAANAENNLGMNPDDLMIAECYADQGPTLKRMQPMAHGRGFRILKRTSHITVVLDAIRR